jgi:hypothetical protein
MANAQGHGSAVSRGKWSLSLEAHEVWGLALADQFQLAGAHVAIAAGDPAELAKAKRHLLLLMPQVKGSTVLEVLCQCETMLSRCRL